MDPLSFTGIIYSCATPQWLFSPVKYNALCCGNFGRIEHMQIAHEWRRSQSSILCGVQCFRLKRLNDLREHLRGRDAQCGHWPVTENLPVVTEAFKEGQATFITVYYCALSLSWDANHRTMPVTMYLPFLHRLACNEARPDAKKQKTCLDILSQYWLQLSSLVMALTNNINYFLC